MNRNAGIRRRHAPECPGRKDAELRCDCPYEASVWDPIAGEKIRYTARSFDEARAWRADAQQGLRRGTLRAAAPVTVNDAADDLLDGMRSGAIRNRSGDPYKPSAIRSYESSLELYVRPELGAMRLGDVRRRHVQALADRLVGEAAAPSTVRNALMPLRVVYRRALRDDLVAVNPCTGIDLPANRRRRERVASREDAADLIVALGTAFDRALWATALYAGLRSGELMGLRWQDVDLAEGSIRVERAYDPKAIEYVEPKSRAGRRRVPVASALRLALLEHRVASGSPALDELVFGEQGRPFDDEAARGRARATWVEAGLEPIGLHEARHTAASVMIAAGINLKALSEFLGHASITITLDLYGHLLPGALAEAADRLDAYLDKTGTATGTATGTTPAKSLQATDSRRS
jgi:integrase